MSHFVESHFAYLISLTNKLIIYEVKKKSYFVKSHFTKYYFAEKKLSLFIPTYKRNQKMGNKCKILKDGLKNS